MLLINAVNAAGRPVELFVKDGKIAAVGQDLSALAGEGETVLAMPVRKTTGATVYAGTVVGLEQI